MRTNPISFYSVNSDKINFKKGEIDSSVSSFVKTQIDAELRAFQSASRKKLTNNEIKSKRNYLISMYDSAMKLLQEKVNALRDGAVVFARLTERGGYDVLIAKDEKDPDIKKDLGVLNRFYNGESRPISCKEFCQLVKDINTDLVNDALERKDISAQRKTRRTSNQNQKGAKPNTYWSWLSRL